MNVCTPAESESLSDDGLESVPAADDAADVAPVVPPTRRQKMAASALSVFGFIVFYLLSAGPVAGIHNVFKVGGFQKAVEVIYAPVVFLVKRNIEPFSSIMKWYVDLFR